MNRLVTRHESPEHRLSEAEQRHRELDTRLRELGRRAYLTPTEQREMSEIKKRKLIAKDVIASLRPRISG